MRHLALVLTLLVATGCSSIVSIDLQPRIRPLEEETVEGEGRDKILLLDLSGMLSDERVSLSLGSPAPRVPLVARVREELRKAQDDERVKALIVRINSPGGTITASDILYHELLAFKARKKIPVIAAIMDVGASGGYYVALAADTIMAHPTTVTGSIGVVMLTINAQGLLEKIGVSTLAIKSGDQKDAGSPFRALTPAERDVFQGIIDEMQGRFVRLIAASRKLPEARVRGLADGRVYTAEQALGAGLVDRIGYMDEAVAAARQAAGLDQARVIMYQRPRDYRATYYAATPPTGGLEAAAGPLGALIGGAGPRFMYLWLP